MTRRVVVENATFKQIGIKVPQRLGDQLVALARRESNGVSAVCRRLLTEALEHDKLVRKVTRPSADLRG
jgi:hypothetical protein